MQYSNSKFESKKKKRKTIPNHDKLELSLLNLQLKIIYIYMLSDLLLIIGVFEIINLKDNNKETESNAILLLLIAKYLALIASILIYYVNFTRYNELQERWEKGELNNSIEAENIIKEASILTTILYTLNTSAYIEIYKASFSINIFKLTENNIEILYLQASCFFIRFLGDYFLLNSTLKSINLIKIKYDKRIKTIENPDIDAVIAGELYVIQRGVLYETSYTMLLYLINNGTDIEKELLIFPRRLLLLGNIFGVTANISSLIGLIKIYTRNKNEPIFGR